MRRGAQCESGDGAALVFPKLFFPGQSASAGVLAAFGTYFVGFAARPVGAAIFGRFGDRLGRKSTLVATLMLGGISTFLIGCLPDYATIGFAAPVLLIVLRVIQGIGVGGEWGGSVLMAMEWALVLMPRPDQHQGPRVACSGGSPRDGSDNCYQ